MPTATYQIFRNKVALIWAAAALSLFGGGHEHGPANTRARASVDIGPSTAQMELVLRIREAYNHLDSLSDDTAQKIFLQILKEDQGNPDACLGLGLLHYRKGLLDPAVAYLIKADRARPRFLDTSQRFAAPLLLAAIHQKDRRPDLEEAVLRKLLVELTGKPDGGIRDYRDFKSRAPLGDPQLPELDDEGVPVEKGVRETAAKAFFALGLITVGKGTGLESRFYFDRCVLFRHRARTAHLYLAHFFATRSQDDVDAAWTAWHKAHTAYPKKEEDRNFLMRHHLRLMEETDVNDRAEADFLLSEVPQEMKRQVKKAVENGVSRPKPATVKASK